MLNHIWLALIVIGILTAAGRDIYEVTQNAYGNDIPWQVSIDELEQSAAAGTERLVTVRADRNELQRHFVTDSYDEGCRFKAQVSMSATDAGTLILTIDETLPPRFATMAEALGSEGTLTAQVARRGEGWEMTLEPVSLVYLKRVTNAAFDIAGVAVQIAIGLIGIMALWLGVMKVAEQAGLITHLARLVRPITVRLFPDVPADHPAVGSMIMNISANMLGLGNAATPFGLKAMEELDKLNPKHGVATDSMVTFLALNTSCVTLIPATAIAVRSAAGSSDPAFIIGTSFLASLTATIFAVTLSKLLARVKMFRWDRSEAE